MLTDALHQTDQWKGLYKTIFSNNTTCRYSCTTAFHSNQTGKTPGARGGYAAPRQNFKNMVCPMSIRRQSSGRDVLVCSLSSVLRESSSNFLKLGFGADTKLERAQSPRQMTRRYDREFGVGARAPDVLFMDQTKPRECCGPLESESPALHALVLVPSSLASRVLPRRVYRSPLLA